ncbi:capsular biosynthesis protein [Sphingorhabdus lutea]|uniref:Capsular biosynthesis protein n=1 Tax=Sphingorhabdus lutea TaxID=1913578 RepID=A0A1L3J968_9SPHN|nr:capsular biosynthesis protein [Sphingorhabdus lutea]APG61674.1 capsular biosynthesis protein [Sphingorhabdus lutea]
MVSSSYPRQDFAERLICGAIIWTWGFWLIGGLYVVGPVLGWVLLGLICWKAFASDYLPKSGQLHRVNALIWLWPISMIFMLIVLIVGHGNWNMGTGATIKSSIGWAKGWALIAIFIMAGAMLPIRAVAIDRSIIKLGRISLFLIPLFIAAPFAGLPQILYVSPLKVIGGPGPEYFAATLYTIEPGAGTARWQFFSPWSPAAGLISLIYFYILVKAREKKHKILAATAFLLMMLLSQSRLAILALIIILALPILIKGHRDIKFWFLLGFGALFGALFAQDIITAINDARAGFEGARADSSRVRAALGRIAVERWQGEAYWFGHAVVERGPHMVEYMPIGSHHSWYGLLFVKGLLGLICLAAPMLLSSLYLLWRALMRPKNRTLISSFIMMVILWLYSFGENLEILAYQYWPALILIGMGFRIPKNAA